MIGDTMSEIPPKRMISIRLDEDLHKQIQQYSKERGESKTRAMIELIKLGLEKWRMEKALEMYRDRKVSLWKAASIANVSLWEMIDKIKEYGIYIDYTEDELTEDLEALSEKK
jgi:predicted HTH domain antitoxin